MNESSAFGEFVRPRVYEYLRAAGLDVVYHRGIGDSLFYKNASGTEVEVLDLVGGFGASLFGHNHPELLKTANCVFESNRPNHAQASVRESAGRLAEKLNRLVGANHGFDYMSTFSNSGTEAVEAAIKHAEMERRNRIDEIARSIIVKKHQVHRVLKNHSGSVDELLFQEAANLFEVSSVDGIDDLFSEFTVKQLGSSRKSLSS